MALFGSLRVLKRISNFSRNPLIKTFFVPRIHFQQTGKLRCYSEQKTEQLEKKIVGKTNLELKTKTSEEIQEFLSVAEPKSENEYFLKKNLLMAYIREKNYVGANILYKQIEGRGLLRDSDHSQLIKFYVEAENYDTAFIIFNGVKRRNSHFSLKESPWTLTKLLEGLLNKKVELLRIRAFIDDHRRTQPYKNEAPFSALLHRLAEGGNVEQLNTIFRLLITNNCIRPSKNIVGSLVKVHLVNNNLSQAVAVFEKYVNKNRITPAIGLLYDQVIAASQFDVANYIFNLEARVHGRINASYSLVFAYAHGGWTQHTRNVFEIEGLSKRLDLLEDKCKYSLSQNRTTALKTVLEATYGLDFDRQPIYYYLLLSYCGEKKVKEALDLWDQQQKENLVPTLEFKKALGDFLDANNIDPPFEMNKEKPLATKSQSKLEQSEKSTLHKFDEWKRTKLFKIDSKKCSELMDELLRKEYLNEANELAFEIVRRNKFCDKETFALYLRKLVANNRSEIFDELDKMMSNSAKISLQFEDYRIEIYINRKEGGEYLKKLVTKVECISSEEDLKHIVKLIPQLGSLELLKNQPELFDEYAELAEKCFERRIYLPMNVLWVYRCLKADDLSGGESLWTTYLSEPNVFMKNLAKIVFGQLKKEKLQRQLEELNSYASC